jgi:aspartate 1-decarboxylase
MQVFMLKCKIHRATVTDANLNYVGSITVDEELMAAAGLFENEKVTIADIDNGERFDTYVIKGEKGKGDICLNGAAARLVHRGDKVIIMAYCMVEEKIAREFSPVVVHVNENNKMID